MEKTPAEKVVIRNPPTGRHTGTYKGVHQTLVKQVKFEERYYGLKDHIFNYADLRQAKKST